MGIDAGQQHGSRGRRAGRGVEVREAHAGLCQRIEVWRLDLAAIRAHIREPHVIGEDDDDVRSARFLSGGANDRDDKRCDIDDDAHCSKPRAHVYRVPAHVTRGCKPSCEWQDTTRQQVTENLLASVHFSFSYF